MFPERLTELREERNLSKTFMGKLVGVTRQAYAKYEEGKSEPDIKTINKLASYFEVDADFLLGRTDDRIGNTIQNKIIEHSKDDTYDSLAEINKMVKEFDIEDMGFFDIEKWKNLSPEDVDEIRRHFEWVAQKAKERNEEK